MSDENKRKRNSKIKEISILVIFIAVLSFTIIEVKDLLNSEKIHVLTSEIGNTSPTGEDGILATLKENAPLKVTGSAIAVLDIPAYDIRGQIVEGTDDETLKNYIGKFDGTADAGEIGNFCLAAHNNIYTEIFRDLYKVQVGDKIRIVTRTNEFVYKVTSTEVIQPTRTDVLNPSGTGKREITLITCTQAGTKRVCVKGEFVSARDLTNEEIQDGVK